MERRIFQSSRNLRSALTPAFSLDTAAKSPPGNTWQPGVTGNPGLSPFLAVAGAQQHSVHTHKMVHFKQRVIAVSLSKQLQSAAGTGKILW